MSFSDNFFNRVEKKTKVDKNMILELAKELQENNLKNENTLKNVIHKLSAATGKKVSEEQEKKIINAVINDKVPKDINNMF